MACTIFAEAVLEHDEMRLDRCNDGGALPLPLAGEGGERVYPQWDNLQEEKALTRRAGRCFASPGRADLSRKRER
ncbi:hypothetical protein XI05_32190 [Bradyrhizobium sp. CCBAU 11357]|nr:hypothetical protein [Bradyrhizobium sp. CCBAU 11357]